MALLTAALIGGSIASGLAQSAANVWAQKDQQQYNAEQAVINREFNSAEAQKQRDFEKEMASTQYQRAVQDMEAAGLNPASLGGVSSGNAVPGGSAASSTAAHSSNMAHFNFGNLFSNAVQYAIAKDKNFENEVIAGMYVNNARQMNQVTNEVKQTIAQARELNRAYDRETWRRAMDKRTMLWSKK